MQNVMPINDIRIAAGGSQSDGKSDRWAKAMARYRAAQAALAPFEETQDLAEQAERAARRVLEEMAVPDCLTVEITTEIYFSDGLHAPLHKLNTQPVQLRDGEKIDAYAKDDTMLRDRRHHRLKRRRNGVFWRSRFE